MVKFKIFGMLVRSPGPPVGKTLSLSPEDESLKPIQRIQISIKKFNEMYPLRKCI